METCQNAEKFHLKQKRYLAEIATCFCGTVARMVFQNNKPKFVKEFIGYCARHRD